MMSILLSGKSGGPIDISWGLYDILSKRLGISCHEVEGKEEMMLDSCAPIKYVPAFTSSYMSSDLFTYRPYGVRSR